MLLYIFWTHILIKYFVWHCFLRGICRVSEIPNHYDKIAERPSCVYVYWQIKGSKLFSVSINNAPGILPKEEEPTAKIITVSRFAKKLKPWAITYASCYLLNFPQHKIKFLDDFQEVCQPSFPPFAFGCRLFPCSSSFKS